MMAGPPREFKGPGQDIKWGPPHDVMTALIEYLTVLLEYINLASSRVESKAKCPSCPPPPAALDDGIKKVAK